jgi:hypothetical protein
MSDDTPDRVFTALSAAVDFDKHDLDNVAQDQPELVRQARDQLAECTDRRDAAKRALDAAEAEADIAFRDKCAKADVKVTEAAVKNAVILDREVVRCKERLAELQLRVSKWAGLCESYDHRRKMIERLTELYTAPYWSTREVGSRREPSPTVRVKEVIRQNNARSNGASITRERI